MKPRIVLLVAALFSAASLHAATTTVKFCTDSTDNTSYETNVAAAEAAGWIYYAANGTKSESGTYTYPAKFTKGSSIASPTYSGEYVTNVTFGAKVSNVARTILLTPIYEGGQTGTVVEKALSSTGSLENIDFSFSSSEKVVSFSITFTVFGTTTAYLYYATVSTGTAGPTQLAAPQNLTATATTSSLTFFWDAVTDATGYAYVLTQGVTQVSSGTTNATTITFNSLAANTEYAFSVTALGDGTSTTNSEAATKSASTTSESALDPPAAPTVSNVAQTGFTLSWSAVTGATGYGWQVLDSENAVVTNGTTAANGFTVAVSGLSHSTAYTAQVKALGDNSSSADSSWSAAASVTTLDLEALATPTNLAATTTDDTITLTWDAVANASSYTVTLNGEPAASDLTSATHTFSGLVSGTTYSLAVTAVGDGVVYTNSAVSESLSATTTGTPLVPLFEEYFSSFDSAWGNSQFFDDGLFDADKAGWFGINAIKARSCVRFGRSGKDGSVLTPIISLTNNLCSGTATLSFYAATAATGDSATEASLVVYVVDADSGATNTTLTASSLPKVSTGTTDISTDAFTFVSQEVAELPERFQILFEASSGEKRIAIDSVKATQIADTSLPALSAPVAVFADATSETELMASWNVVEGAVGYAVELRDADGARLSLQTGIATTNHTFTGLVNGTTYALRVRALVADGSTTTMNSPWSESVSGTTLSSADRPVFTVTTNGVAVAAGAVISGPARKPLSFVIGATVQGSYAEVSFSGLSPAAATTSPSFNGETFAWTATDEEAGSYTATFTCGAYTYEVPLAIVARPELLPPTVTATADVKNVTLSWAGSANQDRASSYAIRIWRGSVYADHKGKGIESETFFDCATNGAPVGWIVPHPDSWYGYEEAHLKFDTTGDAAISKLYDSAVTNLAFHTRSTGSGEASAYQLYASTGSTNENAWILIDTKTYDNEDYEYTFAESDGYRRFKWVFNKVERNLGLGNVVAKHPAAKVVFSLGDYDPATEEDTFVNVGAVTSYATENCLRAETSYIAEVVAIGDDGTTATTKIRFTTLVAPKTTLLIVR